MTKSRSRTRQSGMNAVTTSLCFILSVMAWPAVGAQEDSIYTSYDWQADCRHVDAGPADADDTLARLVCPGPDGMLLMLADDDGRISLDYAASQEFGPWESFQRFNDVYHRVEWRRQPLNGKMTPFATIHRWFVEPEQREILVVNTVARLAGQESCMVGYIDADKTPDANRLARQLADRLARDFACGHTPSRAFGWVDIDLPAANRVAH